MHENMLVFDSKQTFVFGRSWGNLIGRKEKQGLSIL